MDPQDRDGAVEEHLKVINGVLQYCGFTERVRVPEECTPSMFICIFETLFSAKLNDILRHPQSFEDHLYNCQSLLATLSQKVLKVDLSYITGESICNGDNQSIMLLIEIFYELMKIVISRKKKEENQVAQEETQEKHETEEEEVEKNKDREEDTNPKPRSTPQYVSTPPFPPAPSSPSLPPSHSPRHQQSFAKNHTRMPSPIKTVRDSASSVASSVSSSSPSLSHSPSRDGGRAREGRVPFDTVNKDDRRRTREGDGRAQARGGSENHDSNVMLIPDSVSTPSKKTSSPTKADIIERKISSAEKRGKPMPHGSHSPHSSHSPNKKRASTTNAERERERDELARCVDNIDREIRATEEAKVGRTPSSSPAKRVHFTPSLSKISSHVVDDSGSFDDEDQESFKENIKFGGADKEFYENLMDTIPEHVSRYVWENPLRQWLKIRPMTSPDKAERIALAKYQEQEMAHRTSELVQSMIKDYEAARRRNEHLDRIRKRAGVHADIRDRREQMVRLKKMDSENEYERKSRMLKRQSHEELLYKNLFAQSLKIQKQRIIEERKDSRERKEEYEHQCAYCLTTGSYLQQYDLLRSQMGEETRNQQISEHAQKVALKKMEAELKKRMKDQLELLKEQLRNEEDLSYFRLFDTEKLYDALTHH